MSGVAPQGSGAARGWATRARARIGAIDIGALRLPSPVVWTAVLSGLSVLYFAFVMPIGRGTDEQEHAFRIYQLASGGILPELVRCATHASLLPCRIHYPGPHVPASRAGGHISATLYRAYLALQNLTQRPGEGGHFDPQVYANGLAATLGSGGTIFAHFENTALYSPVNYLPQTLVFWIGREGSASIVGTVLAARLLTGIVWASVVTAAVAIVGRWQWLFAFVVLVPTALTQGPALATDSASLALVPLTIACALRFADRGTPLRDRELALLSVLCLALGLLKVPTPVLILAVVAIAWRALGDGRGRAVRLAVLVLPGVIAAAAWTLASNHYFVSYRNATFPTIEQANINQGGQEHYLLTHLYDIPALLWNSATAGQLLHLGGLITTIGQDGNAGPLPEWISLVWLGLLALLAAGTHEGRRPSRRLRASVAGTALLYGLAVALGIYLTWVSVGAKTINGIHGRYSTPALILLVPLLAGLGGARLRLHRNAVAVAVMAVTLALTAVAFARASQYYYGEPPWQAVANVVSAVF